MSIKNRNLIIFTLGALSALGPFSIDMYLPAFPAIAKDLNTNIAHIQLSLTSYFIGISLGQLLYGPIIDRFGRMVPLFIGLFIYLITGIFCVFAQSADSLIILRFLQALGSCAGMVVSRAMVRDIFPVNENAKIFSLLILVIGVSPILAPTLGGLVNVHLGWRYIFVFLVGLSLVTIALCYRFLSESKPADKTMSLKPKAVLANFWFAASQPQFIFYALAGGIAASGMFAYISGSAFVFINLFGVSEVNFGYLFAFNATGLIIASQVNRLWLSKRDSKYIIVRVSLVQLLVGLSIFSLTYFNAIGLIGTIALIYIYLAMQGFLFPNCSAVAMAPFTQKAGIASALLGFIQMFFSALASAAVSVFFNQTALPMTAVIATCAVLSFSLIIIGRRFISKREQALQQKVA
jgi:DHA1 family bicyclomycin/chloramphenicol resistance-like MFS transporter